MNNDADERNRRRLASAIDDRRLELRLPWADVATRAGITRQTLRRVRRESSDITSLTKRGIEQALAWQRGSIDAVLAGGEPTPVDDQDETPQMPSSHESHWEERLSRLDDLTDDDYALIQRLLRDPVGHELGCRLVEVAETAPHPQTREFLQLVQGAIDDHEHELSRLAHTLRLGFGGARP